MSLFSLSDLLDGSKRFFVGLQGKKSDSTMETLSTNDAGALKVSAELTGSNVLYQLQTDSIAAGAYQDIKIGVGQVIDIDPSQFKSIKVSINDVGQITHVIEVTMYDEHTDFLTFTRTNIINLIYQRYWYYDTSDFVNFSGNRLVFRVYNRDTVAHTYNLAFKLSKESGNDPIDSGIIKDQNRITHTVVEVATTSNTALAGKWDRSYTLIINDSDTDIYLNLGTSVATVNKGIRLNAHGGSYEMSRQNGNLYRGEITAIHGSVGVKKLLITESELL